MHPTTRAILVILGAVWVILAFYILIITDLQYDGLLAFTLCLVGSSFIYIGLEDA